MYDVVKQVLSDLEVRVEQTGAKVNVEALPVVHGDPTQIHQLMLNLIGNALKFKRHDVVPEIRIFADGMGAGCQIVVEDNGIGFDEQHTEKIFAVFQRLHGREYEGSGIGLALCRKIALRHGGDITVKSKVGVGSSFIVTLPLNRNEEILQEGNAKGTLEAQEA